jgi:effector-binding domain-containing protein
MLDDTQPGNLPEGKVALIEYTCEYQHMTPAYDALHAFITEQGYEPNGVAYDYYLNSPDQVPMDKLKTRIPST